MSERKAAGAEIVERRARRGARHRGGIRQDPCQDPLPVGLADHAQANRGRDQIGEQGDDERLRRAFARHAMARRRRGDRDRIGDRVAALGNASQRLAVPRGAGREAERAALRGRLQPPLGRAGERDRQLVDFVQRAPIRGLGRAMRGREQDRVDARRAERGEVGEPCAQRAGVDDVARLDRPFQAVRIGERADRKRGREPEKQRQFRASRPPQRSPWP